jgi:uridine kinase
MIIIGIAGGTGSGKTTVVKKVKQILGEGNLSIIPQDSYYWDNSHKSEAEKKEINFDHPASIEWPLLLEHLQLLKSGETIQRPVYSYLTCSRAKETVPIHPTKVVIVEGILLFTDPAVRDICDIKIYVDAPADDRLLRVIERDIRERGRDVGMVLDRYLKTVKPMHEQFIEPTKKYADIIVPQGGENHVAIDVLASMISLKLGAEKLG